ncbi:type II toxin-antitoxin system VapB family antitoxin [Lentisphaera profundi]|uniref:Type II toxin-antitoxin system VapB family antitoxin n=1 Tax=Lentisphaera profundi TaxID=1658616 RepID=A0ABY7VRP2_9BACT|nr:type II toxin-antitoxin system VapB family antitoxin [Lentisphaera profundi]WDE95562.1 type II toxin-antitoxin system VapB family antitoxin [Lentisphaera profundi]
MSRTNIVLDDDLIENCMNLTGLKTKKSLVDYALRELVRKNKQKRLLELPGKINWEGSLEKTRNHRFDS